MKKSVIFVTAILLAVIALTGCFESSDLIGKWRGDYGTMEFKSGSMIKVEGGQTVETKIDQYVTEKDRLGFVIDDGGTKHTMWFDVIDRNTISVTVSSLFGSQRLLFQRVK